jgi:pimeloyl-ACP methyl ester carboxylesterase
MTPGPADDLTVEVDGCPIHARSWGDVGARPPAILLVHGSAAHAGWWDPMAEDLATDHRVVALDLSGHGDSGWREQYAGDTWAAEVGAVIDATDVAPVLLIGHSLGSAVAIATAARRPEAVAALVLIDPLIRRPDPDAADRPPRAPFRAPAGPRTFATLEEAKMSFHVRPNEPILNRDRLLEVAADSFREEPDGWTYKADPRVHARVADLAVAESLGRIACPALIVHGAHSPLLAMSDTDFAVEAHAGDTELQTIRDGYHHLMFDHGPELVARIRAFAATLR